MTAAPATDPEPTPADTTPAETIPADSTPAETAATTPKAAPGWYIHPETKKNAWWDGTAWAAPAPKKKRTLPLWVALAFAAIALLIGVGVGGAGGNGARDDLDDAKANLSQAEDKITTLEDQIDRLKDKEAELDSREADLVAREAAVTQTEDTIAANTIPGDGLFIVGMDVQPGTYKSDGGSNCYWARLNATGDDIIDNYLGSGATVLTIQAADGLVETSGCAPVTKVG